MNRNEIQKSLRRISLRLGLQRDWYLIGMAAVIGLIMGTVAVAFIYPLHRAEEWFAHLESGGWRWLVLFMPMLGALIGGVVQHLLRTEISGPGVAAVLYAIHRKKSRMAPRVGVRKWIAATFTIGAGGSAGAEGPIVTIGAVIGSNIGRKLGANPQSMATLLGCGAAAGISAVFNAPIAGIFFVLEILLRDFSLRTFTPIVIASVVSAAWAHGDWALGVLGDEPIFFVDPAFFTKADDFSLVQIPNYLLLGFIAGVGAAIFIRTLSYSQKTFRKLNVHPIIKPAIGGALLGVLGLVFLMLNPHDLPPFFGNGYGEIERLLRPDHYQVGSGGSVFKPTFAFLLFAIVIFKGIATCLTIGSGGEGGLFAPALFLGAAVGGLFGYIVNAIGWFPAANPATYALVGMASMIAATTHAPLTGIIMVYELTQSYSLILPLMFAAVISTIVGRLVFPESVYTVDLAEHGLRLGAMSDLVLLRRLFVHDVKLSEAVTVRGDQSAERLLQLSEEHQVADFVVVDEHDKYVGMVTNADLREALVYREAIPLLQVDELQRTDLPTVLPDETLDVVLDKFAKHDVQSLAVMDGPGSKVVRGLLSRSRLMAEYQRVLSRD